MDRALADQAIFKNPWSCKRRRCQPGVSPNREGQSSPAGAASLPALGQEGGRVASAPGLQDKLTGGRWEGTEDSVRAKSWRRECGSKEQGTSQGEGRVQFSSQLPLESPGPRCSHCRQACLFGCLGASW
jgi:hypothetical protein